MKELRTEREFNISWIEGAWTWERFGLAQFRGNFHAEFPLWWTRGGSDYFRLPAVSANYFAIGMWRETTENETPRGLLRALVRVRRCLVNRTKRVGRICLWTALIAGRKFKHSARPRSLSSLPNGWERTRIIAPKMTSNWMISSLKFSLLLRSRFISFRALSPHFFLFKYRLMNSTTTRYRIRILTCAE